MKKKWIVLFFCVLAGVFALVWLVGIHNPINSGNSINTQNSIAKQIKTTPDSDWILDPEIPANYVPVPGETDVFMVVDTDGSVKEYRRRSKDADGAWNWETIENETGKKHEKVKETEYGDLYKISDLDSDFEEYKRFVVDSNNGFAWVSTNADGLDLELPEGDSIPDNYVPQVDNIFAKYNTNGVLESYLKRALDDQNNYTWSLVAPPRSATATSLDSEDINNNTGQVVADDNGFLSNFQFGDVTYDDEVWSPSGDSKTTVARYRHPKQEDGYIVTYETKITRTEDKDGNLLKTNKEEYEVSRVAATGVQSDLGSISPTLDGETFRMSSKVSFNTDLSTRLLDLLNADRSKVGLSALKMDTGNLYKIAEIKCAEATLLESAVKNSQSYGTISNLAMRYGVTLSNPDETILQSLVADANTIHTKFQSTAEVKALRMNAKNIAITVAERNGKYYVYEAYEF